MSLVKKLSLASLSVALVAAVSACSSSPTTSTPLITAGFNGNANFRSVSTPSNVKIVNESNGQHIYVDAGKGVKSPVTLSFKLNTGANSGVSGFGTKSANGTPTRAAGDVQSISAFLFEADKTAMAATTAGQELTTVTGYTLANSFSYDRTGLNSGDTVTVTFVNVPQNTAGTSAYYIAAAADLVAVGGTVTPASITTNITSTTSTNRRLIGGTRVILNSGTPAYLTVDASNQVFDDTAAPSTADLNVALALDNGSAATITGAVTVTSGTAPVGIVGSGT